MHLMVEPFENQRQRIQAGGRINAIRMRVARREASRRDQRSGDEARLHYEIGNEIRGHVPIKHGAEAQK